MFIVARLPFTGVILLHGSACALIVAGSVAGEAAKLARDCAGPQRHERRNISGGKRQTQYSGRVEPVSEGRIL